MVRPMSPARFLCLPALLLTLAVFAALPSAAALGDSAARRPVLVELYTSQGCDSCPPADAFLGQLAARKDVIALSLPITYWDMLGWKDTLGSDACTRRQKAYAQVMGHGGVYTPQMVIDGVTDMVGSKEAQIDADIAARLADEQDIPVTLSAGKSLVHIAVAGEAGHGDDNATVWLFRVLPQAKVAIGGGENKGRTLTYRNVVRGMRAIGIWNGQPFAIDLPREDVTGVSGDSVAVVVQQGGYGRVVGAAMLTSADMAAR